MINHSMWLEHEDLFLWLGWHGYNIIDDRDGYLMYENPDKKYSVFLRIYNDKKYD